MSLRLSLRTLQRRCTALPMLRILLPFAAGVTLAMHLLLPLWVLTIATLLGVVIALLLHRTVGLCTALLAFGWLTTELRFPSEAVLPTDLPTTYRIRVEEDGALGLRGIRSEGVLEAQRTTEGGRWLPVSGRVILRGDSTLRLHAGDRLLVHGRIYPFRRGSESFRRLMLRRGYRGTCYLSERSLLEHRAGVAQNLHLHASRTMRQRCDTTQAAAVVRAMTVGDRTALHPELRAAYARSGMAHLLAVSGLHTGMLFVVVNLLLWWLPVVRYGHLMRNLFVVVALWLFVAAAGFPPSAVRAAVMCTLLQGALATSSRYGALNSWAAAALGMLLWNPRWIGDIGFQLSFVAVAAILLWGVPLSRWCHTRWRMVNWFVQGLLIGFVASLATAPLTSYSFGLVPLTGLLLNPIAVLLGSLIVGGGVCLLLLPPLDGLLAPLVQGLASLQNSLAEHIAAHEGGALDYTLSREAVIIIYLLFALVTLVGWAVKREQETHLPKQ